MWPVFAPGKALFGLANEAGSVRVNN
ncbi:hypothetical protein NAP1_06005 [Erythrobacter sp. NAP1]|nr:hypothetical protein NAP1_06005 [Erythrobacter sp. NAP1]